MLRTIAATSAVTILLALPGAALSMNGRTGGADGPIAATPVNYLHDAKYTPAPAAAPHTVQVVRFVRPSGFNYRDAGIGAAIAVLLGAAGAALILVRAGRAPHATGTTAS